MLLVRAKIIRMSEVDLSLAGRMNAGTSAELVAWVDFAMTFVSQCLLVERIGTWADFGNLFDQLGKAAQRPGQHTRKINKFMEDLRAANNSQQAGAGSQVQTSGEGIGGKVGAAAREQVTYLLERWIRVWNESGGAEQKCVQYIALLHQQNVLKTEEMTDVFLRVATELCVEACVKTAGPVVPSASSTASSSSEGAGGADSSVPAPTTQLAYTVVDAYSSLLVILVKYASADPQSVTSRVHLLGRILSILHRALLADMSEASSASKGGAQQQRPRQFDQRPYFRILVNLLRDLNTADPVVEQNNLQVLGAFAGAFHALQPSNAPAFAFAWLELISHRSFMPALLLAKPAQKGWMLMHRLLVALFSFMGPFLRRTQLPPAIRTLYRGTLRMVLVLLHDFPEFLCDYHLSFCDVIPANCIQLRNLFLSAFPRAMRLPDPFTPNLKVDLLPEISQHPRILSNIVASLTPNGLRTDLDSFLKQPSNKALQFLEWLPDRLRVAAPPSSSSAGPSSTSATSAYTYNVPAINSLVVYIGAQGIAHLQNKSLPHSPVMEIFQCLMLAFDAEGRYYLLNAIANQLRYPNNHTHYFSCVLLFLFAETSSEFVKEQITRVLLERLIVHRPHPWGLLITFIELIKNPRYNFWAHKFTHCATEIEKVFESVARSCMGPGHAAGGGGGGAVEGGGGTDSATPAGSS
jgi:CCR4-NOT transcription complex subunit 1